MAAIKLYLVDTNVLLRWVEPTDADYEFVSYALDGLIRSGTHLCYTPQNIAEFWNACTRAATRNGFGLSPLKTDERAKKFESRLRLLPDSAETYYEWRKLVVAHNVSGVQVHDAKLVASMFVHKVHHLITFNHADFGRYPDIEAVHPSNLSAAG